MGRLVTPVIGLLILQQAKRLIAFCVSLKRLPNDVLLQAPTPVYALESYTKQQLRSFQAIRQSVREKLKMLLER